MANNNQALDHLLVKVEGYSANRKYMYARRFPDGEKITVAVKKNVKIDFIDYLGNEADKRHAPKGSTIALFNLSHIKDSFYITSWAKAVSKKPQTEDVIVTPTTVSPVINLGGGKTQVLSRLIDPIPFQTQDIAQLRHNALQAVKSPPAELKINGNRGFMVRVSQSGVSGVQSASFKGLSGKTPEQLIEFYFGENGNNLPQAMKSIFTAAKTAGEKGKPNIEVVAFTDAPVFNYGNSQNDHKLASVPNFRLQSNQKNNPTFSNAAITIDRQDNNKVLRITPLPDKKIVSDVHALVGSHSKLNVDNTPFILPKQFKSLEVESGHQNNKTYPVSITPFIDESNKQFNSIFVQVRADAPPEINDRILNAINVAPRKGAGGYYFNKSDRKKVESSLSDLAGTPALYTANGTIGGERYVFIAGRTNEPKFKEQLDALTKKSNLKAQSGGLYSIPEADSIQALTQMADLLKESATSKITDEYFASKPTVAAKETPTHNTRRNPTYVEWLDSNYRQNPELIAREFDAAIEDKAKEAGIDWYSSKSNIIWPSLDGEPESIGTTANVKPENPADNGSCYISTMFNSWQTAKGNKQYGIIVTFTNLNKDRDSRWSYSSHNDTYERYSNEVWGNESNKSQITGPTAEELAEQQRKIEVENKKKRAIKVANSDAQKNKAFNHFSSLPTFTGDHEQLSAKQLPNFAKMVDAKAVSIKENPNNKAFAFAAYDIHERFVGYQYITEEKLLLNKEKPNKKNSWSNKLFNFGFQKDDVRSGLPLGTHRTLGEIDPNNPHTIYYAEGWANAASNFEVTNTPSVLCFDKDNMKKVIGLMVKKYPNHNHIHVADNDMHSPIKGNVGVMSALDTSYNFGAKVVIPDVMQLENAIDNKFSDTSDLYTNNARDLLASQLNNPQNLSDVIVNHLERIKYTSDNKLDYNIALLALALDKAGVNGEDKISAINESLQLRTNLYAPIDNSYRHKYSSGFNAQHLKALKSISDLDLNKTDYNLINNTNSPLKRKVSESNQVEKGKTEKPSVLEQPLPEWPVIVKSIINPNPKTGSRASTITEITDATGEYRSVIIDKLDSLKIPYTTAGQSDVIYAPYKFINLINSGLSGITGAPTLYAGRSRTADSGTTVLRGDFTNQKTLAEVESTLKPLGITYNEDEMGYVITDANTFVFVKEALIDNFQQANPNVESVMPLELDSDQQLLTSNIDKVAFSLGLEKKALAKQQLKLNQHNPQLANLNSPLIAGVYAQAENKIKNRSELVESLSPAERVYMQQRTLLTMLSSFNLTQPSLDKLYREDVDAAVSILKQQMQSVVQEPKKQSNEINKTIITPESKEAKAFTNADTSEDMLTNELVEQNESNATQDLLEQLNDNDLSFTTLQQQHALFQELPVLDEPEINAELTTENEAITEPVTSVEESATLQVVEELHAEPEIISNPVESPVLPHKTAHEIRVKNLVEFVDTFLANEYTAEEVNESLREPGSPYYDHVLGFQSQLIRDDIKKIHNTSFGKLYNLPRSIESSFSLIAAVEKSHVDSRLAQLDLFIDEILKSNPNFKPKRVSTYAIQGSYRGIAHPYIDEDGQYNKALLKSDLMHIDGYDDVTTLTGYFALQQQDYLDGAQEVHSNFKVDEDNEAEVEAESEDALVSAQVKLMNAMPAPPSSLNSTVGQNNSIEAIAEAAKSNLINNAAETVDQTQSKVEQSSPQPIEVDSRTITINNDNDDYTNFYALAIQCAKEEMNYEEFYEAVLTPDGVYFEDNPFAQDGKLDKKSIVNALKPNGFTSPKRFFESAFEDVQGKPQSHIELTRTAGLFPAQLSNDEGIGSQFNAIDTLLAADSPISLEKAQEITKKSFNAWYNEGHGDTIIAIHPIFSENIQGISATELAVKYNENEIKLLADVMCVSVTGDDDKEAIAGLIKTQWKERVELQGMTKEDFQELSNDDIQRVADVFNVPFTASKADMARQIYNKTDDIKQLVDFRIAQYSYVVSALTIEREKGFVPSFVYRQLESLIAEESNYKPVILDRINKTEIAKLHLAANDASALVSRLSDQARVGADLVEVPSNPEMIGVDNADIIGLGDYKYVVTNGTARQVPKPPHMTGFALYGDNQILAPAAFSFEDLRKYNIEPVSRNAVIEALAPSKALFEKQGYISFATASGQYGVIYQDKNKCSLKIINDDSQDIENFKANSFNDSLDRALDFFPASSIEFSDGFSASMANNGDNDITLAAIDSLHDTLLDTHKSDGSFTELSKDIALDLLAKANELNIQAANQSIDNVIQAVSLIDDIKERYTSTKFASLIGMDNALTETEQSLLAHAVTLGDTAVLEQISEQLPKEDDFEDLIAQLNASALRDLNTTLALDGDALTLKDVVDAEPYIVNQADEELALKTLSDELKNEVETNFEVVSENNKVTDENADALKDAAFFESEGVTSNKPLNEGVKAGDIVTYTLDGNTHFGYVAESNDALHIEKYTYQDEYNSLKSKHPDIFLQKNGDFEPVFALNKVEFSNSVKATGITGNQQIDRIVSNIGSFASLSVKELRMLAELTGVKEVNDKFVLANDLTPLLDDYFRVNQLGAIPAELHSDEDKTFINQYFGDNNAHESIASLTKELTSATSKRIIDKVYSDALLELQKTSVNLSIINHENNTLSIIPFSKELNIENVDKDTLINTLKLPVSVLKEKEISLAGGLKEIVNSTVGTSTKPKVEETIIATQGDEVFATTSNNSLLIKGQIVSDLTDEASEAEIRYIDLNGNELLATVETSSISLDIDEITYEAKSIFETYMINSDNTPVHTINNPYSMPEDDAGLTYIYSRMLANQMLRNHAQLLLEEANTPKGYELVTTNDQYHIAITDNQYEQPEFLNLGKFDDINTLNKAILVAKRNAIGASKNDQTNPLWSQPSGASEAILPETTQDTSNEQQARSLHDGKTGPIERNGESSKQETDGAAVRSESELHRERDSARSNQPTSNVRSEVSDISTSGVKLNPNVNYSYNDGVIKTISAHSTETEAYQYNISAIKLAKALTKEKRPATLDEKNILAQYRGWGGLSRVFDNSVMSHANNRVELQGLLTAEEYSSIKRSTLSAFYTSPAIVDAVWQGMSRLGVKNGFGLDPAFGIGNFASAMPAEFQGEITLQAKELDPLTAEIARHIHGTFVKNEGYEKAKIPSNTFDFAIGNIPFGDFKVYDKNHRDLAKHQIHDYFILKSIDKVKPGGFVSFITSSGTLDKKSSTVRELIAKQADLVGAMRLPTDAFNDNARTQVNSDILFFQKRHPDMEPANTNWLDVDVKAIPTSIHGGFEENVEMNRYFIDNPAMIIGKQHSTTTRFGGRTYRTYLEGNLSETLYEAISQLPQNIHFNYEAPKPQFTAFEATAEETYGKRVNSYHLDSDGDVAITIEKFEYNSDSEEVESKQLLEKVELKKAAIPRMVSLISLRDTVKSHINLMLHNEDDKVFSKSLEKINNEYDTHTKKFGPLNLHGNKSAFKADPDSAILLALEKWDKKEKVAEKADIFHERTVYPRKVITHTDSLDDAVLISLSEKGKIVPEYIESLTKKEWPVIVAELGDAMFLNPQSNEWEHSSTYLAGQVLDKIDIAKDAANENEIFKHNLECLQRVVPTPIPYYEIRAKFGSSWIPESDVSDFMKFIITGDDTPCTNQELERAFKARKVMGGWELNNSSYQVNVNSGRTKGEYGTEDWPADQLLLAIANNKSIGVYGKDADGKRYMIADRTAEANAKADLIKDTFKQWLWDKPERAERLESLYNRKNNGFVEPVFDGSKLEINGLASTLKGKEFKPRKKQMDAIMRYIVTGRALFLHDVGVGKSFALLGSIMKGKEIGRHNKAMLAVPNPVFAQMQDLAHGHFPNAKILMIDAKSLNTANREATLAQVSTNSWDAVVISHSIATRISVPDEFKLDLIEREISEVENAINSLEETGFHGKLSIKGHQRKLENEKAKIYERMDSQNSYDTVNIEEMGVDAIFVDEADEFVNLSKVTNMGHVAGVNVKESAKARALFYLTQYMHENFDNQGVVLATGTDIRNNIGDQFALLRYLAPDLLREQDIDMYDDFIGTFGEIQTQFEIAPEGTGFIEKTRLSKFYNLPELSMFYRQVADIVNAEDANVVRPNITEEHITAIPSPELSLYMECLAQRAQSIRNGGADADNLLAITNDGRKVALDLRFVDERLPDYKDSKVNHCVKNVLKEYENNKPLNPSQIIFSDIGVPNNEGRFDLYADIKKKLTAGGIPEEKIVFARDYKTDSAKQELQDKMNTGEIAVAIGTTENMGVGKNVQERLAAIHDLSIPWRVRDLEQRGGRIERFGNIFENASRYKYSTQDSFDLFIWNKLKQKALFAAQTKRTPRDAAREFDEEVNPGYSEVMATLTGNPLIEESISLESKIDKLSMLERAHHRSKSSRKIDINISKEEIVHIDDSLNRRGETVKLLGDFKTTILGKPLESYEGDFSAVAKVINKGLNDAKKLKKTQCKFDIGEISGRKLIVENSSAIKKLALLVEGDGDYKQLSEHHFAGSLLKPLINLKEDFEKGINQSKAQRQYHEDRITSLESVNNDTFPQAEELREARQRLTAIQREMAEAAEADALENGDKEDPLIKWNKVLSELDSLEGESINNNEDVIKLTLH